MVGKSITMWQASSTRLSCTSLRSWSVDILCIPASVTAWSSSMESFRNAICMPRQCKNKHYPKKHSRDKFELTIWKSRLQRRVATSRLDNLVKVERILHLNLIGNLLPHKDYRNCLLATTRTKDPKISDGTQIIVHLVRDSFRPAW